MNVELKLNNPYVGNTADLECYGATEFLQLLVAQMKNQDQLILWMERSC